MSSGGGKGGKNTEETVKDIPDWLKQPAIRNIQRAEDVQRIEYMPYRGAEIAAFNEIQNQAMNNNLATAKAFGLLAPDSTLTAESQMPTPTEFDGGFKGYSSMSLYDQALAETKAQQPGAIAQYEALFGAPAMAQLNAMRGGGGSSGGGISPPIATQTPYDPTSEPYYTPMGGPRRSVEGGGGAARARQSERLAQAEAEKRAVMGEAMKNYQGTGRSNPRYVSEGNPHSSGGVSSRLDSKGYTPTNVSQPLDEIIAGYRSGK